MADIDTGSAPAASAASSAPASATATPSSSGSLSTATPEPVAGSGTPQPGEPPRERWNDILDNARKKTRAEVEQESRQRYGQYDEFERDPWSAVQGWLSEASKHSVYGPMVKQWVTTQSEQGKPAAAAQPEPQPDTPIVNGNNEITGYTYSDKALRQWQQWNETRLRAEFDERLGPIEKANTERANREQHQEMQTQANTWASQTLGQLRQQPYFKEHEPAVRQALLDHPAWGDNIHAAFNYVLQTQILPNLSRAEQKQAVDSLTGKSAGSSVAPGGTAPGAPKFKSFKAAAQYYQEHPEEAAAMAKR